MARSARLGEYFIVVGAGDKLVPIAGQTSADPLKISFQGEVLDRYPLAHSSDGLPEFPPGVAMFCLPNGLRFSAQPEMPIFFSFASTLASGDKLYGACLKFYEEASPEMVNKAKSAVAEMHRAIASPSEMASVSIGSPSGSADEPPTVVPINAIRPDHSLSESGSEDSADQGDEVFFDVEEAPEYQLENDEVHQTWFAPKCICILSTWPFFGPLRTFLTQLYRISLTPTNIPLERHLVNFLREVPVPPRGRVNVQFAIADQTICLSRPALNDPFNESVSGFEMTELFELLPVETVITILECLLLERKVIFISSQYSLLMSVTESFLLLLYPFRWQHVYIPLLPEALLDFLNAPMPLLIGTHHSFVHSYSEISDSVILVNIDTQVLQLSGNPPRFPEHERTKLLSALKPVLAYQNVLRGSKTPSVVVSPATTPTASDTHDEVNEPYHAPFPSQQWIDADLAFSNVPPPDMVDNSKKNLKIGMDSKEIRQAFFRVYVSMLKNYRDFIVYPNEEDPYPDSFFKTEEFIETFPHGSHRFLNGFLSTQAFAKFIEERVMPGCEGTLTPTSSVSDNIDPSDADVLFFDESIIEKHNRSKFVKRKPTPFLDTRSSNERTTFVAPSPDASNLSQKVFKYDVWPVPLNPTLFSEPRIMKSLLNHDSGRRRALQQSKKGFVRAGLFERRSSNSNLPNLTSQRYVYSVWFSLLTAICISKRKSKLLTSAFSVLDRVRRIGIPIDQQCYRELIQSCGKCKSPELALIFLEHMQRDGIIPDASIYSALFTAFSTNGDLSHAYHTLGTLGRIKKTNVPSPDAESAKSPLSNSWRREKPAVPPALDEAECKQRFESACPGLQIVTAEVCPQCSKPVSDDAIRYGWKIDSNDYTTACRYCESRFVPRFCISKSDGTDQVYCEYLSPPVLQKEIDTLIRDYQEGAGDYVTSRTFHLKSPTVFWNLIWHLTNLSLPISHLISWMGSSTAEKNVTTQNRNRSASEASEVRSRRTVASRRSTMRGSSPFLPDTSNDVPEDDLQQVNVELP